MKIRVVVNPDYANFLSFVEDLPYLFDKSGEVIYKGRNELRLYNIDGIDLVVKSFKIPNIVNQLVYSLFRPSKSRRSYEHALRLLDGGFNTPVPIAYVETRSFGLFKGSYFVSFKACETRLLREFDDDSVHGREALIESIGSYLASLHEAGIYHEDFSPGNVMFDKLDEGDQYSFSLVDINRMNFGTISERRGYSAFRRLWGGDNFFRIAAASYARARGYDPQTAIKIVREEVAKFRKSNHAHQKRKAWFQKIFGQK
ncbi:MAG: lipopolysaccharide kinase InaA family protein [Bacteroidales bacterium]